MSQETQTRITVEQFSNGERVFVLDGLKFNRLWADDVMHSDQTQRFRYDVEMKIIRGDQELRARTELFGPQLQGGGYEVFYMLGAMFIFCADASVFEKGDVIFIPSAPDLRQRIVDRWYKRIELGVPPWKERFEYLWEKDRAICKEIDDRLLTRKLKRAQHKLEWDARSKVFNQEYKALRERLRAEEPLPEILRFT